MGVRDHMAAAKGSRSIRCAVLTVSDTRTPDTDESGDLAVRLLEAGRFVVEFHGLVHNNVRRIQLELQQLQKDGVEFILAIGGTGVGRKDVTVEAVQLLLTKELPGFGELFRRLSFREIGPAAMLSRALLGVTAGGCAIAVTPGSPDAVRLALEKLLIPQIPHLLHQRSR